MKQIIKKVFFWCERPAVSIALMLIGIVAIYAQKEFLGGLDINPFHQFWTTTGLALFWIGSLFLFFTLFVRLKFKLEGITAKELRLEDELTLLVRYRADSAMKAFYVCTPFLVKFYFEGISLMTPTPLTIIIWAHLLGRIFLDPLAKRYFRSVGVN